MIEKSLKSIENAIYILIGIFWISGFLFTLGQADLSISSFFDKAACALFTFVLWPFILGVIVSK